MLDFSDTWEVGGVNHALTFFVLCCQLSKALKWTQKKKKKNQ